MNETKMDMQTKLKVFNSFKQDIFDILEQMELLITDKYVYIKQSDSDANNQKM